MKLKIYITTLSLACALFNSSAALAVAQCWCGTNIVAQGGGINDPTRPTHCIMNVDEGVCALCPCANSGSGLGDWEDPNDVPFDPDLGGGTTGGTTGGSTGGVGPVDPVLENPIEISASGSTRFNMNDIQMTADRKCKVRVGSDFKIYAFDNSPCEKLYGKLKASATSTTTSGSGTTVTNRFNDGVQVQSSAAGPAINPGQVIPSTTINTPSSSSQDTQIRNR